MNLIIKFIKNNFWQLFAILIGISLIVILLISIIGDVTRENSCKTEWAHCILGCSSSSELIIDKLDVCLKKCDIGKEACLALEN